MFMMCTAFAEAGRPPPPTISLFAKPRDDTHGHEVPIIFPEICQDDQADYGGELCFIIGKDAKYFSLDRAIDYIGCLRLQRRYSFAKVAG
jgi:2-keto-4-pentenoate hydratase/2-oxohepta-3-ene-1,7-dioic acid hydratase in catechol pathway